MGATAMYGKESNYHRMRPAWLAARPGRAAGSIAGAAALAAALLGAASMPAAAATPQWNHIAAGTYATCGIRVGNTLWCWGSGHFGALGTGQTAAQDQPQQITRPTAGWASVTAGWNYGCATRSDGSLWCWGYNAFGELGIGTTTNAARPNQVTTPASTGWTSVTAGIYHTCATRSDGTLWCWGWNGLGELGIGSTTGQHAPKQVTTPAADGWASVTAGGTHTCANRSDATLWCWGYNHNGQVGNGTATGQDAPQQVTTPAAGGWASVTAGNVHTCAIRSDATLWCWGWNGYGQLGIGSTTDQDRPQQVTFPASTGWTSVTGGAIHTCATRTHALWCWGYNGFGQLGIGSYADQVQPHRVVVPSTTGWSLMALGDDQTCATHTGSTLWCWGWNAYGQLGIGSTTSQNLPQQVAS